MTFSPPDILTVSVIGGAVFTWRDRDIGLRNRKARAMLAYLALTETGEESRERLAGLFWSETGEQQARATLRQAVHEARESMAAAGCPSMFSTRTSVGLRRGTFAVDIAGALAAVAGRDVPDVLMRQARVTETLIAGFDDLDPAFHAWLIARRQTLHDRLIRGLEDAYRAQDVSRHRRRRLGEAVLTMDPTNEEACRVVMRCAAEDGDTSTSLRVYNNLYRLLGDDYDMEPSVQTQELVALIKQGAIVGESAPEPPPGPPGGGLDLSYGAEMRQALVASGRSAGLAAAGSVPAKPALYIRPFATSGVGLGDVHLVEGFRIELIACLIHFREWYVSGSDNGTPSDHGGPAVSARYVVTTNVYQAGATMNVVMVLQEQLSGLAIWGERFELSLDRWLSSQHRIVRRIASTLNVQVSAERLARVSRMPEGSLEAYDSWLRGQMVVNRLEAGEWNRAVHMITQAIEKAPTFSPLYSCLAQMNNLVHFMQPGMFRDLENARRTVALAQKSVALDPYDSRAELCLGWAMAFSRRHAQARLHMDIACELNSNDSWTLMSAAMFHAFGGDAERAAKLSAASMDLTVSPSVIHWVYLTSIRFLAGDNDGTIAAADRTQYQLITVLPWRAAALCGLGRKQEAATDMARFYAGVRAAWSGGAPPDDAAIGRWLLHLYPIGPAETWRRLRDGLVAAGLPAMGLDPPP